MHSNRKFDIVILFQKIAVFYLKGSVSLLKNEIITFICIKGLKLTQDSPQNKLF